MSETPQDPETGPEASGPGYVPGETDVRESDPNADSDAGLAGGMGVSSERLGRVGDRAEATHGAEAPPTQDELPDPADAPPEQSEDGQGGTPPQR